MRKEKLDKMLSVFLAFCLAAAVAPCCAATARAAADDWDGTASYTWYTNDTGASEFTVSSAEELAGLANLVNGTDGQTAVTFSGKTVALGSDIDLNPDYTFTFIPDTGLVAVNDGGSDVFYLGTGAKGAPDGSDTQFDGTAAAAGGYYYYSNGTGYSEINASSIDTSAAGKVRVSAGSMSCTLNTWAPIGTCIEPFSGTFDGGNHTIGGIYINSDSDFQGLFGYKDSGAIENACVSGSYINGGYYIGGIVGYGQSTVESCRNTGSVSGIDDVGGIAGFYSFAGSGGGIRNCCNFGSITGSGTGIGGIAGYSSATGGTYIKYCYNAGGVSGSNDVGGIAGLIGVSEVSHCYNVGGVSLLYNASLVCLSYDAGGIVGYNGYSSKVSYCYNAGSATGSATGTNYIGGVAGYSEASETAAVANCYYDNQMCPCENGIGYDDLTALGTSTGAAGMATSDMTPGAAGAAGSAAAYKGWGGDWKFTGGLYPQLAAFCASSAADAKKEASLVSVAPITLASGSTAEAVVSDSLTLGVPSYGGNSVTWSASPGGIVSIAAGGGAAAATIAGAGTVTLTATLDGSGVSKTAALAAPLSLANTSRGYSESNPIAISSAGDLAYLSRQVNAGENVDYYYYDSAVLKTGSAQAASASYRQTADIELNENTSGYESWGTTAPARAWTPIGNQSNKFTGMYDGSEYSGSYVTGMHIVSGIYIDSSNADYQGLFGYIGSGGAVKNLGITESYIKGDEHVGAFAGCADASPAGVTIMNCYNTGSVGGSAYVGGIAGEINGANIQNCYNTGSVGGSGNHVGGIVGCSSAALKYCYNIGGVTGNNYVGGVTGNASGTVQYCYNVGGVAGNDYVGGVAGNVSDTVQYCYSAGTLSGGAGCDHIGGVAGDDSGSKVSGCYFDKQMCAYSLGIGSDSGSCPIGKPTTEMIGTGLKSGESGDGWTVDYWSFTGTDKTDGLYPRLISGNDASYVSASPVFLDVVYTDGIVTGFEKSGHVTRDFSVGKASGVEWSSSPSGIVTVGDKAVTVSDTGSVTLSASKNGIVKNVVLTTYLNHVPTVTATGASSAFTQGDTDGAVLFSSVSAAVNDDGQTFSGAELTVSNVNDTTEYLTVSGTDIKLENGESGTVAGVGSYGVSVTDNTAAVILSGFSLGNTQMSTLISGIAYRDGASSVTTGTRTVTLTSVTDSGSDKNSTAPAVTATVKVGIPLSFVITRADASSDYHVYAKINNTGGYSAFTTDADADENTAYSAIAKVTAAIRGEVGNGAATLYFGRSGTGPDDLAGTLDIADSCVYLGENGTYTIKGLLTGKYYLSGSSNNYVIGSSGADIFIEDGASVIYNNACQPGYALRIDGDCSITVNGGRVYSEAGSAMYFGGYCSDKCRLSITGSKWDSSKSTGTLVEGSTGISFPGEARISGGSIVSTAAGCPAMIFSGTGYISGGVITGANSGSVNPGTVFLADGSKLHVSGGTITDTADSGYAIYNENGLLKLSGKPVISGPTADISTRTAICADDSELTPSAYTGGALSVFYGGTISPDSTVAVSNVSSGTNDRLFSSATGGYALKRSGADLIFVDAYNVGGTVFKGTASASVEDVTVKLYASGDTDCRTALYTSVTDAGGAYTIENVPDGSYVAVVAAVSGKYKQSASSTFAVSGANVMTGADITLKAPPVYADPSGGGSEGGGSGSGAEVDVNGSAYAVGETENGTDKNGKTKTTVTVDNDKFQNILENQGEGATVTIPFDSDSEVAAGVLTGEMIDEMERNGATLVVRTDSAAYKLPSDDIDIGSVSEQFGEDVSLSEIKVTVEIAEPSDDTVRAVESSAENGGYDIMIPAVDFSISCEYNGRSVNVSNFNSYVERLIKIPDGVDPEKITTGVIVKADGTSYQVPTKIVAENGIYYVRINSLTNSTYAVIRHTVEFGDMAGHWAKDSVNDMGSRMIVSGAGDNNYAPDRDITRAEFSVIMVRALGLAPGTGTGGFGDVKATDWFGGYAETAAEYGIILGCPDGTFRPNDTITREQAMTMTARAMKLTGLETTLTAAQEASLLAGFEDGAFVSSYAVGGTAACISSGVVNGRTAGTLAPRDNVTRAEAAVIIERLLQKSGLI